MVGAFPIGGNLDPKAFPFLLMDLHKNGATGSLKVEGPSYQKALYFRGGRILFGSSNDPRDQLGAILIESGKLTPEQLEDVNTRVGPGNPLAKVLSESGFVNQRELAEAARSKVERIFSDVIAYPSGSFEFEDGVLPKGAVDLKLSTEKLVLAAVRRVGDRSFVPRFLDSPDVVLAPTDKFQSAVQAIEADSGGLPAQLDGSRTLREAAGLAGLDEYEAAKIACALLFLGLLERQEGPGIGAGDEAAPAMGSGEGGELDLTQTARIAFHEETAQPAGGTGQEAAFFLPPQEAESSASSSDSEPLAFAAPEPPTLALPGPAPEPPPPSDFPAPAPRPPAATRRSEAGGLGGRASPPPFAPEPESEPEPPRAPRRPSKDDLAALDVLLGRPAEGPLAPLEKTPTAHERWAPKFTTASPRPRRGRERRLGPLLIGGGVLALAGAGAAAWYFLGPKAGSQASPHPAAAVSTRPAVPATQPPAPPTTMASTAPSTTLAAAAPPTTPPAPAPAATRPSSGQAPSPVPPTSPRRSADATLGSARERLRHGALEEAGQGFASALRAQPAGSFSIQIMMACAAETVQKAVQSAPDDRLFIVPVVFQGRSCHRIGWGIYGSEAAAQAALSTVPRYFTGGGARPRVVASASMLP